jgi:hypothetical protein
MDLWDRLALAGRRYQRRHSVESGNPRLHLGEVLRMFDHKAIMEAETQRNGNRTLTRPDPARKLKISLLDVISEIQPEGEGWYEVFETPPSGDLSKVRIVSFAPGMQPVGELRLLVGRRTLDHYFPEDPLFASINRTQADA